MSEITPIPEPGSDPLPEPDQTAAVAAAAAAAAEPIAPAQPAAHGELLELALLDLRERRAALLSEIQALEQRRRQLETDLDGSLSGRADGIARRLKGFQDYLVVALQDLASQAELMDLVVQPLQVQPSPLDPPPEAMPAAAVQQIAPAAAGQFSQDAELIRDRLARFQGQPDFYADPWKLRRSLEPAAAALLDDWFLNQGGRGAQASTGSRNRNALITAGAVAILGDLYGDRFQTLVLAGEPERLGEWRRGLQDCLGLAREDFGPNSGIVLFERPDALIERADRLEERGELPFIVIDAAEQVVDIPVLQFPLWLAFAATANELALEQDLP